MINTGDRYTVLMSPRTQQELITRHGKSTLLCDYSNLVSSDASSHESLKLEIVPQDPKEPTELRSRRIRARRVDHSRDLNTRATRGGLRKIRAQHDSSEPVPKLLKTTKNQENLNKTFLILGSHIELKHFLAAGHQSDLNQRTEHEVQCRLSAEFVQRQRDLPLMPLVTAAIGCAINNPIAPKSSVFGKPMRHCACKNNE